MTDINIEPPQPTRKREEALKALALLEQRTTDPNIVEPLRRAVEDNKAFNTLFTDPNLLADYVNQFFGPDGPYPVELPRDRLRADVEAAVPTGYQRPQMEITPPPELIEGWCEQLFGCPDKPEIAAYELAHLAAQWGADQATTRQAWIPAPQTPDQVAAGLREAFRKTLEEEKATQAMPTLVKRAPALLEPGESPEILASLLSDAQIQHLAETRAMIAPYVPRLVRVAEHETTQRPVISYGQSSYGYDLRLSPKEFQVFRHIPGTVMDPKNFNPKNLEPAQLQSDCFGNYFVLPHLSYGLGVTLEKLKIPPNITCLFLGKSTYARLGIIANLTPGEAGWEGHLTLEFSNASGADCRIYAGEGVVQALFFPGAPCRTSYQDRQGKYQGQLEQVTLARV